MLPVKNRGHNWNQVRKWKNGFPTMVFALQCKWTTVLTSTILQKMAKSIQQMEKAAHIILWLAVELLSFARSERMHPTK